MWRSKLDVRHSWKDYKNKYPEAVQQRLLLQQFDLRKDGTTIAEMTYSQSHGDAITPASAATIQLERVYTYVPSPTGAKPETVKDITAACKVLKVERTSLTVELPRNVAADGSKVCVIGRVNFEYPDVFSPELLQFEADTVKQYADVPLAGLMKDEWGFPADHKGNPAKDRFWTSKHREADYAKRTGGRDLGARQPAVVPSARRAAKPSGRRRSTTTWNNPASGIPRSSTRFTRRPRPPSARTPSWARTTRSSRIRTRANSSATG